MITKTNIRRVERAAYRLARYGEPASGSRWFVGQAAALAHRILGNVSAAGRWPKVPRDFLKVSR